MDKSKKGKICGLLGMVTVLIFFIWGMIEGTYEHSWLIFIVYGIACAALSMMAKDNNQ